MAITSWVSNKYESAKSSVKGAVQSTTRAVSDRVETATKAASDLYDQGKATLTSIPSKVAESASNTVDRASAAAEDLFSRGKAGLTKVAGSLSDDSNTLGKLKYANPMFYQGKATEYAGKGLKAVGHGLNQGVEFLDKHSKDLPGPLKMQAGVTAGVLGFAGGLVEGTGSLVDWAGRVQQGDTKTIQDTGTTLKKVGEGLAYIDGKAREGTGMAVEGLGRVTGSETLQQAGQTYQKIGKAEQSLAGEDTRKVLDAVGNAGAHYAMRVGELEGEAVEWVGDKTGSQALQNTGQRMQKNAQELQDQTHNGIVDLVDKAAAERGKEYKENGSYAVTRDVTRVAAEVASLVVAPEALIGKAGTVAKAAEVTGDVGKVAKALDAASDTARVAEGVSDAGRVAARTDAVVQAGKAAETGKVVKAAEATADTAKVAEATADTAKAAEVTTDAAKTAKVTEATADTTKVAEATTDTAKAAQATTDTAKAAEATTDTAKVAETITDATKAAEATTDASKAAEAAQPPQSAWRTEDLGNGFQREVREVQDAAGGPAWTEIKQNGTTWKERSVPAQDGGPAWREVDLVGDGKSVQRSREIPATDGGNPWGEAVGQDGKTYRSRQSAPDPDGKGAWNEVEGDYGNFRQRSYTENGQYWQETVQGNNRWRYRNGGMDGLAQEAAAKGTSQLTVAGPNGPVNINVHGAATPEELARLQTALDAMPPAARQHASEIYLSDNLGQVMAPDGTVQSGVGGLAGDGRMVLSRDQLLTDKHTKRILYHESGHNADNAMGGLSQKPPWGDGTSVSQYGARNAAEDFAENHRVVLEDWQRYQSMSPSDWARESEAAKKMEIVRSYGGTVPSAAEVEQATNLWTRAVRAFRGFQDSRNPG